MWAGPLAQIVQNGQNGKWKFGDSECCGSTHMTYVPNIRGRALSTAIQLSYELNSKNLRWAVLVDKVVTVMVPSDFENTFFSCKHKIV